MLGLIPMKRFGTLDEIAGWVAVLASDVADFMTGAISLLTAGNVSIDANFYLKSSTDFLIILAPLRKCRNCLDYQAFPAFCVSEDTPHIMAYRSLIWRSKVVKP